MDINLSEIEQSLVLVYQKNLNFLKENFFDIFEKVNNFSIDLESNKIQEKYSLELKDGYFDILNLENNGFYYATNSYTDSENRAKYVDTTDKSSFDLLRKQAGTKYLRYPSGLKDILPVVDFVNKKVNLENIEFQRIMKFIYVGVGLGYHLQEIDNKINSYTTLIIEPELEIFRLSLFTTDYTVFSEGNRSLILSIGNNKVKRRESFNDFYNYHEYMNYNIKHYKLLESYNYIQEEAIEFFRTNSPFAFPYSMVIENVKRTISFARDNDKFLSVKEIVKQNIFKDKKVLLISAGPSLDNYIEQIKGYQDKFIIVCVDVIVKKLEQHNIVPNIVFSIDPDSRHVRYLKTKDPLYLKNSVIILLSQQHPYVMELLRTRRLNYYFSQFDNVINDIGCLGSSPNVGTFAFQTMVQFGAKELYLIGNDASFNQETGSRYTKGSSFKKIEELKVEKRNNEVSEEDIVEVKGNLRAIVKTNLSLLGFKYHFDTCIGYLEKHYLYNAYNLSDGVLIEGLIPMEKDEFIEISRSNKIVLFDAIQSFDSISKRIETICYNDDINILNEVIKKTKRFKKFKMNTRDDFLTKKLDMMIWILEKSKKLSINLYGSIFLQYSAMVDSYINFTLNLKQKDLYTKENLNQLGDYWVKGVISVFQDMIDSVTIVNKNDDSNPKYNKNLLMHSLYKGKEEDIKHLCCRNSIGFLATEENLEDKSFMSYIEKLVKYFPTAIIKSFYFNNEQKNIITNKFNGCFQSYKVKDIMDIAKESQVYIGNFKMKQDEKEIYIYLVDYCPKLFTYNYDSSFENKTILDQELVYKDSPVKLNPELFGLEVGKNNFYKSLYDSILFDMSEVEIDLNMNLYEFEYFKRVEYALKNSSFIEHYFNFIQKYKKFLELHV